MIEGYVKPGKRKAANDAFRFIDLFAGIGGFRKAFEAIGGHCVFTCEMDKFAVQTYQANYDSDNEHVFAGDIRDVKLDDIPPHDVLLAGFPCQPFSIATVASNNYLKKPHGFEYEQKGTLFFEIVKILKHHKPSAFVLENVRNLISHDGGKTFKVIHESLLKLGYQVQFKVINSKHWVPQSRERIFIIGFRNKNTFSLDDLPIPDAKPVLAEILHEFDAEIHDVDIDRFVDQSGKVLGKYTLTDQRWAGVQRHSAKHGAKGSGFGHTLVGPDNVARTLVACYGQNNSAILVRQAGKNPRKLTPRECSRLMGFDQPHKSDFIIPVSNSQAYRQFGNAVVVPVVEAIAKHMQPWLLQCSNDAVYRYAGSDAKRKQG